MASFRYLVNDVEKSIEFYTKSLGFKLKEQYGPAMAILLNEGFTLWLAGPMSSAAQPMPDGTKPQAGGWNRFVLEVEDIKALKVKLEAEGVIFRNDIIKGPGGQQVLCEDPSGNLIELFQSN